MFDFSVFPKAFRMRTQIWISNFHNLGKWVPILKWDTSMNSWWNSLIICIQIFLLYEGQNFNPFSCSIFPYFQSLSEWEPKKGTFNFHNLGKWILILKWDTSMNLWWNINVRFFRTSNGFQNGTPKLHFQIP